MSNCMRKDHVDSSKYPIQDGRHGRLDSGLTFAIFPPFHSLATTLSKAGSPFLALFRGIALRSDGALCQEKVNLSAGVGC